MAYAQKDEEIKMLRGELEILMGERQSLLRVVGAAAAFVARLDTATLAPEALQAAERLARSLDGVSEESLQDALGTAGRAAAPPASPMASNQRS